VLATHGAKVAIAGRRIELGRTVAAGIGAALARPDDVRAYELDVTDAASVADAIAKISADLGAPAIVVNNAGTVARGPSLELDEAAWNGVLDVNLSGVFRVAQASAREMVRSGTRGTIINIASILGLRVRAQVAAYAASKAAVVQLTQALALEWAEHGIRVNAIAPGYFETDINRELLRSAAGQAIVARIPQQRVGQPAELDGPLLLLASDASSYMTGAVIPVDGGHLVSTL
jgi:2-deoxy-D-gluconate 3-dehydrogenase